MSKPLEYKGSRPFQKSALIGSGPVTKRLHSKHETAFSMGVSPRTLDAWVAEKRIPFIRLSPRLTRFDLERVKAALDRYEVREIGGRR